MQSCLFLNFLAAILKNLWKIGKQPSLVVNSIGSKAWGPSPVLPPRNLMITGYLSLSLKENIKFG